MKYQYTNNINPTCARIESTVKVVTDTRVRYVVLGYKEWDVSHINNSRDVQCE
jgi:hypothetical protein